MKLSPGIELVGQMASNETIAAKELRELLGF